MCLDINQTSFKNVRVVYLGKLGISIIVINLYRFRTYSCNCWSHNHKRLIYSFIHSFNKMVYQKTNYFLKYRKITPAPMEGCLSISLLLQNLKRKFGGRGFVNKLAMPIKLLPTFNTPIILWTQFISFNTMRYNTLNVWLHYTVKFQNNYTEIYSRLYPHFITWYLENNSIIKSIKREELPTGMIYC